MVSSKGLMELSVEGYDCDIGLNLNGLSWKHARGEKVPKCLE